NGFQILTEVGLLPGALIRNRGLHFICDRVPVKIERHDLVWTEAYQGQEVITLPISHGEGCYYADDDTLKALEDNNQVLFRYCSPTGEVNTEYNPNGSLNNIAGIINQQGNVLGMMPHPERAADQAIGSTDGMAMFKGLLNSLVVA
ncbi:MAG: phosphoribosylformylglycinamidine synthase I, partial [Waterburya sp.]